VKYKLSAVNDELRLQVVERQRVQHELRETLAQRERMLLELEDRKSAVAELEVAQALLREGVLEREQVLKDLADQKFALDQHAIVAVGSVTARDSGTPRDIGASDGAFRIS
jgi:hypothetical protein